MLVNQRFGTTPAQILWMQADTFRNRAQIDRHHRDLVESVPGLAEIRLTPANFESTPPGMGNTHHESVV